LSLLFWKYQQTPRAGLRWRRGCPRENKHRSTSRLTKQQKKKPHERTNRKEMKASNKPRRMRNAVNEKSTSEVTNWIICNPVTSLVESKGRKRNNQL
jgi:hypothetical protein